MSRYLAQIRWVRQSYVAHHLRVAVEPVALRDPQGRVVGYLEDIALRQGHCTLRGWARVASLSLRSGPVLRQIRPSIERMDVAAALGCDPMVGFAASLPLSDGALRVEVETLDGRIFAVDLALEARRAQARSVRALRWRFLREMVPLVPMILLNSWRNDPDLRRKVKTALRLDRRVAAPMLERRFLAGADKAGDIACEAVPVTIVLPVYNAFALLPEVLHRIVQHSDLPWHLMLVEDASTEPELRPWLRDWVRARPAGQVTLLENDANLGFIQSVNRAFAVVRARAWSGPVVLLNSDALVPQGWTRRLTAPLADPDVASVTPLSNDAEIFAAPFICNAVALLPGQAERIDAALRRNIARDSRPEVSVPTGVGFCMAISRDWLDRVGDFDTRLGRGYGEEVDWCRRCSALGGRHVAASDLFVAHLGGASFGAERAALVARNNRTIAQRYPAYPLEVQAFITADPLITPRLVAALAWLDSLPDHHEVPVFVAHSLGGGAEDYLQGHCGDLPASVVLRLGGAVRVQIEIATPQGRLLAGADDLDLVIRLIAGLHGRRIIYSCAVGDPDLREIPGFLIALARGGRLDILFHDYLPISPSYTLLDADGVYRGLPMPGHEDAAHRYRCPDGTRIELAAWQALWGQALAVAQRLVVFSEASARVVRAAYPDHAARLVVQPHRLSDRITPVEPPVGGPVTLGILGAIGPQKGAAVVAALSKALSGRRDMRLVVIGYIAPGHDLAADTVVHGRYEVADIPSLARHHGVTHWIVPAIWPETFSYVTHECLATGLPTLAFDLGAQGDAVRAASNGIVVPMPGDGGADATPAALCDAILGHLRQAVSVDRAG